MMPSIVFSIIKFSAAILLTIAVHFSAFAQSVDVCAVDTPPLNGEQTAELTTLDGEIRKNPQASKAYLDRAEYLLKNRRFYEALRDVKKVREIRSVTAEESAKADQLREEIKKLLDEPTFIYYDLDTKFLAANIYGVQIDRSNNQATAFIASGGALLNSKSEPASFNTLRAAKDFAAAKKTEAAILLDSKKGIFSVCRAVILAAKDDKLQSAAKNYAKLKSDPAISFSYPVKLSRDLNIIARPKEFFPAQQVAEITDADGLGMAYKKKLPQDRGDKMIRTVFDEEESGANYPEAQAVYLYFVGITRESYGSDVMKSSRKYFLNKLYRSRNAGAMDFVKREVARIGYTDQDKKIIFANKVPDDLPPSDPAEELSLEKVAEFSKTLGEALKTKNYSQAKQLFAGWDSRTKNSIHKEVVRHYRKVFLNEFSSTKDKDLQKFVEKNSAGN